MKEEMVVWLNENTLATASQAMVKAIRLAQITSGFVGGVEKQDLREEEARVAGIRIRASGRSRFVTF